MKNSSRQRIEVNVDELDRVLDEARQAEVQPREEVSHFEDVALPYVS